MERYQRYGRYAGTVDGETWYPVVEVAGDRETDPFGQPERMLTVASLSKQPTHIYLKVQYSAPIGSWAEYYSLGAVNDSVTIPLRAAAKVYVRHALKSTTFDGNQNIIPIARSIELVWSISRGAPPPTAAPLVIRNALPDAVTSYSIFGTGDATSGPLFGSTAPAPYRTRLTVTGDLDTLEVLDLETGNSLFTPVVVNGSYETALLQSAKYEATKALVPYPHIFYSVLHG